MSAPRFTFLEGEVALIRFERAAERVLAEAVGRLTSNNAKPEKAWLTNREAQGYLGISRATLARYRADGTLPYSKVGQSVFYRLADVEALLEAARVRPAA